LRATKPAIDAATITNFMLLEGEELLTEFERMWLLGHQIALDTRMHARFLLPTKSNTLRLLRTFKTGDKIAILQLGSEPGSILIRKRDSLELFREHREFR
jgi:hypothetical protein